MKWLLLLVFFNLPFSLADVAGVATGHGTIVKVKEDHYIVRHQFNGRRLKLKRKKSDQYQYGDKIQWKRKINRKLFPINTRSDQYRILRNMLLTFLASETPKKANHSKKTSYLPFLLKNIMATAYAQSNPPFSFDCDFLSSYINTCSEDDPNLTQDLNTACQHIENQAKTDQFVLVGQQPTKFVKTSTTDPNQGYGSLKINNLQNSATDYYGNHLAVAPNKIHDRVNNRLHCGDKIKVNPSLNPTFQPSSKPTQYQVKHDLTTGAVYIQFQNSTAYQNFQNGYPNFTAYCSQYVLKNNQVDYAAQQIYQNFNNSWAKAFLYVQSLLALVGRSREVSNDSFKIEEVGNKIRDSIKGEIQAHIKQCETKAQEIASCKVINIPNSTPLSPTLVVSDTRGPCAFGVYVECTKNNLEKTKGYLPVQDENALSAYSIDQNLVPTTSGSLVGQITCNPEAIISCETTAIPGDPNDQFKKYEPNKDNACAYGVHITCTQRNDQKIEGLYQLDTENELEQQTLGDKAWSNLVAGQLKQKLDCPTTQNLTQIPNATDNLKCYPSNARSATDLVCTQPGKGYCVYQAYCHTLNYSGTFYPSPGHEPLKHTVICSGASCENVKTAKTEEEFDQAFRKCGAQPGLLFKRENAVNIQINLERDFINHGI